MSLAKSKQKPTNQPKKKKKKEKKKPKTNPFQSLPNVSQGAKMRAIVVKEKRKE